MLTRKESSWPKTTFAKSCMTGVTQQTTSTIKMIGLFWRQVPTSAFLPLA
jgi:hypothetical protein